MATVVNRRRESFDVYIGRGSKWGNPYSHKQGTKAKYVVVVASREEAISEYRKHLRALIECGAVTQDELLALDGKRLGCYCKPLACHGDVIVEFINLAKQSN